MGKHPHTVILERLVEAVEDGIRQGMSALDIWDTVEQALRDAVRQRSARQPHKGTD